MKKGLTILLATLLLATVASGAVAKEGAPAPTFAAASHTDAGLTITARASKGMYRPGEPVQIDVAVRNASGAPVVVTTRNSCDPGTVAFLLLQTETEVPLSVAGMEGMMCAMVMGTKQIPPGGAIKATFSWPAAASEPGFYTVRVSAETEEAKPVSASLFVRIGGFRDMESHWAESTVVRAAEQGIIAGYPDGSFRPGNPISRGEFIKLLLASRELPPGGAGTHWASPWLNAAQAAGIATQAAFDLDQPISRIEMAELIVRATGLSPQSLDGGAEAFTDMASLAPQERFYAQMIHRFSVARGYPDGSFGPDRSASRAEALAMIVRLNDYLALKPDQEAKVLVGTQVVEAKVLAATDFHPALIQVGPVAAAAGIDVAEQADGSWVLSLGTRSVTVTPGSPSAGGVALHRPAALLGGDLYVTATAFTELGAVVSVVR